MITTADLASYVNAKRSADPLFLQECLDSAAALISAYVDLPLAVPAAILDNATKQVAGNLYQRRAAALATANLGDGTDFAPVIHRPALDPMTPAWPLLRPWKKSVGFA